MNWLLCQIRLLKSKALSWFLNPYEVCLQAHALQNKNCHLLLGWLLVIFTYPLLVVSLLDLLIDLRNSVAHNSGHVLNIFHHPYLLPMALYSTYRQFLIDIVLFQLCLLEQELCIPDFATNVYLWSFWHRCRTSFCHKCGKEYHFGLCDQPQSFCSYFWCGPGLYILLFMLILLLIRIVLGLFIKIWGWQH